MIFVEVNAVNLIRAGQAKGLWLTIAKDTAHTWAQRSAGDETYGKGKAGTFVCTFCGQERNRLSDGGLTCTEQFEEIYKSMENV